MNEPSPYVEQQSSTMFHSDDDPNWTGFSMGMPSTSTGSTAIDNSNNRSSSTHPSGNFETNTTGDDDDVVILPGPEEITVKVENDVNKLSSSQISPSAGRNVVPPQVQPEVESLRDIVNFKEVVGTFKIFVAGLPPTATNDQLREMFAPYGTVLDCEVFKHKNYAFVVRGDI